MQSVEEFAGRLRYREIEEQWDGENETYVDVGFGLSDQDAIEEVAARDAEWQAHVDKFEAALRYLYDSGPTPEGFRNLDKDCYEYAIDMLNPGEDELPDKDPRWFDGWLRMIEESAASAAIIGEEE